MAELNSNYDEDSLYCPECSQYWTRCECMSFLALASDMMEEALADELAEGIENNG